MPSQKLTPTFCMEDMDTLDMPDTMDIPSVRHIQGVHILHTEGRGQLLARHQRNAFHKLCIQDHGIQDQSIHIQDHVHSILRTEGRGQHQP